MLVIDNSELVHRLLRVRLQAERFEIKSAFSSKEGLVLLKSFRPDIVIIEINLGANDAMDGFQLLTEIKNDPKTNDVAVILITASIETMDCVRALELGASDFINKPFEVVELKARVRSALRVRSVVRMLAEKAKIDGLTGLWNRAYFNLRMEEEINAAGRHGRPLSLILCDLDHFKSLNDEHGHPFGDSVIQRFSQVLGSGRKTDIACRYGGEEFALILPDTERLQAAKMAERVRAGIEHECWLGHENLTVTASFGVGYYHAGQSTASMIADADQALYRAKTRGRNRVEYTANTLDDRLIA
jgi:diguanylate cyclase (GGDEF)-like protein